MTVSDGFRLILAWTYISPYFLAISTPHKPCFSGGSWNVLPKTGTPGIRGGSLYFRALMVSFTLHTTIAAMVNTTARAIAGCAFNSAGSIWTAMSLVGDGWFRTANCRFQTSYLSFSFSSPALKCALRSFESPCGVVWGLDSDESRRAGSTCMGHVPKGLYRCLSWAAGVGGQHYSSKLFAVIVICPNTGIPRFPRIM